MTRIGSTESRRKRAQEVDEVIKIIGSRGRRFFYSTAFDRYARVEVDDRGKIWWIDEYAGTRIYTHRTGFVSRWRGFSNGGTLRALVEAFRDYICTGVPLPLNRLGPEGIHTSSNLWGYPPDDMRLVREDCAGSPVFSGGVAHD